MVSDMQRRYKAFGERCSLVGNKLDKNAAANRAARLLHEAGRISLLDFTEELARLAKEYEKLIVQKDALKLELEELRRLHG